MGSRVATGAPKRSPSFAPEKPAQSVRRHRAHAPCHLQGVLRDRRGESPPTCREWGLRISASRGRAWPQWRPVGADAGLSRSVAVCRRPREPARMSRDLYGSRACDLMRWRTRGSARWLISVPAPTDKGIPMRRSSALAAAVASCLLVGRSRDLAVEELCGNAGRVTSAARDSRNGGMTFGPAQDLINKAYPLETSAHLQVERDAMNEALRIGWHAEALHTAASISKLATEQCIEKRRSANR